MKKKLHTTCCDEEMFNTIFKKLSEPVYSYLYYKFGNALNPKDKTQEAFITLWQHCGKVPPEKAKSFLFTTATRLMLNEIKHQKVVLAYGKKPRNYHTNETPEFILEETQYKEKVQVALQSLTEAERVAFLLNRTEGKKYKEIASLLDISVSAVEKRIYSALIKLRKHIKEL